MGNTAASNDYGKSQKKTAVVVGGDLSVSSGAERQWSQSRATQISVAEAEETAAGVAAQQQRQHTSTWSLGSLSGRWNWSFTGGASRNSFRNRNKSTRKSFTSLQQRRAKTTWHKPLTNTIFSSHFKESSRNDQFHIEYLVAKGAFGVVFKVRDKQFQQSQPQRVNKKHNTHATDLPAAVYALKVLKKSKIISENSVQQIKDEADIQKLCGHHPFIVQQVDLWQNRHNLHILSEYVPNGELFSKIAQFSIDLIRLYLAEIALAIDFLHNAGIIYRDAKPENILLTENYHIKLTDFGLSKWLKLGATTKTMCGTFQYMAPEILRGDAYGHAVDWWSLGIIVCQMLTQKSPDVKQFLQVALPPQLLATLDISQDNVDNAAHNSQSREHLTHSTTPTPPESLNFLPPEVDALPHEAQDVLQRLLAVDPKQRIRSVLALQKIALYKNYKIDSKHLRSIQPLDIIARDQIPVYKYNEIVESSSCALELSTFHGF